MLDERSPRCRVRVFLTSEQPSRWSGQFSVEGGALSHLQWLGSEYDAAGNAHLDAGVLNLHLRRPSTRIAFDVTVHSPGAIGAGTLRGVLNTPGGEPPQLVEAPVAELLAGTVRRDLGRPGTAWIVQRQAADHLRVQTGREQLVFAPGESFSFEVQAAVPGLTGGAVVDLAAALHRGRAGAAVWQAQPERRTTPVSGHATARFTIPLPEEEGVYSVRLSAIQPPGAVKAWLPGGSGKRLATRVFQLVVFDRAKRPAAPSVWRPVQEIDPTSRRWWDRLPRWVWLRRAASLPEGPLGSGPAQKIDADGGRLISLGPGGPGEPAWQAYPLPVTQPGRPHVVEVQYPADAPQQLVVTVIDQDGLGAAGPFGASTGVVVGPDEAGAGGLRTARQLFWPKSSSPLLVLSNGSAESPARYGRIRVLVADDSAEQAQPDAAAQQRLPLAQLSIDDLTRSLGVSNAGPFEHEDWQSFYQVGERLADWLTAAGFGGATLTVARGEGTLFASRVLPATPGLDREPLVSGAVDLPRKDVLRLLLMQFERRGLRLIPALRLESLTPGVEATRRSAGGGQTAYSPLQAPVRQAVLNAVEGLLETHGGHRSFAGVALEVSDRGYAAAAPFPDVSPAVFDRFLKDTGRGWPSHTPRSIEAYRAAVAGPWATAWREWQTEQITALYAEASTQVAASGPDRRLVVLADQALLAPQTDRLIRPRIGVDPSSRQALLARGIDPQALRGVGPVRFAQPRYTTGVGLVETEAGPLTLNAGFRRLAQAPRAVALIGLPQQQRLRGLEQASPFAAPRTDASLVIAPQSGALLEAYASLAAEGPPEIVLEGGTTLGLSLDERLVQARRKLASVPPRSPETTTVADEPVVVRAASGETHTTLLAANTSPWPVTATLTVRTQAACSATRLVPGEGQPQHYGVGEHALPLELGPFEVRLVRFDSVAVEPLGVRRSMVGGVEARLAARLEAVRARNLNALSRHDGCPNPSFEEAGFEGGVLGWAPIQTGADTAAVATTLDSPADGARSIRLAGGVGVRSDNFIMPPTGQLATVFRVRGHDLDPDAQLRVSLLQAGGGYRSHTIVPAEQLGTPADGWRPFVFSVDDLPVASGESLRLQFEVSGGGSLDLDHVEMYDLVFPLSFLGAESAKQKLALIRTIHAAETALAGGRYNDCRRLLGG
ncbi:MAG: hypothetical protein AAF790_03795, partial [Planctomycetota bacterium]